MVLLDRFARAALIARVARGTTTLADAQLLDRVLPHIATRAADAAMPEAWSAWHRGRSQRCRDDTPHGIGRTASASHTCTGS